MTVESKSALVRVETHGPVATLALDNPPLNVLSLELVARIGSTIEALAGAASIRAIVVTGTERAFSAGADVRGFASGGAHIDVYRAMMETVSRSAKPTIAAIRGFCLGGGLELALSCDFRVAARDAQLGFPEITLGLLPGAGGTQRLPRLVGPARAALLCLTGRPIDGQRAYEWGLVEDLGRSEEVFSRASDIAINLAAHADTSVATLRELLQVSAELPLSDGLTLERTAFLERLQSSDGREGLVAFLDRRPPQWNDA